MKIFELRFWLNHPDWPVRHGYTPANAEAEEVSTLRLGPLVIAWETVTT